MDLRRFLDGRGDQLAFLTYQHASLVIQCVLVAVVIALVLAAAVYRSRIGSAIATAIASVGMTIPSLALLALLLLVFGLGVAPSVTMLGFYATLPILTSAIVGLRAVPPNIVEAARGIGMPRWRVLATVELPHAWPVILTGIRVSTQLVVGVATVVAYVLGPGLGSLIFSGLARLGGAGALESALTGTVLVVIVALVLDGLLVLLGRFTVSKGLQ
ncbi:ABC transporter permease [Tsukamurella strandjordii]|uniref:ABC transporter permease n=1 Tax=Tsukamurella TaxID=2060 RepID=UPI001C7D08DF|nr:ABC transporter permease subunit [Tsukamurella sp. TY48]GIZ97299.1 putative ABC transporter, permease protein [Tsukamurella sp. TY48]